MQIVVNLNDIDWDCNGEYGIDPDTIDETVEQHIRDAVIGGLQDRLVKNVEGRITKKLETVENEIVKKLEGRVNDVVDTFLEKIAADKIKTLKIPYKKSEYGSTVEFLPITEYIGKRYEEYIGEKRFNEKGEKPSYSSDAKYSLTQILINRVFGDDLDKKVVATIKQARETAEKEIIGSLENTLQQQLTADIIAKINVPQMLKRLQEQYGEKALKE
jgi:hypothetical protein